MSARVRTDHKSATRPTAVAAVIGVIVGGVVAGGIVFLTLHRDPNQPGTGPCADAAEAWAQVDLTARWEYEPVRPGSTVYAPSDDLVLARGRASLLLDDCRAAGS